MEKKGPALCIFLVCLMAARAAGQAQCNNYLGLAQCAGAAQSNSGYPGDQCCQSVEQFRGQPDCLCQTMLAARSAGVNFDIANAMTIVGRCGYGNQVPQGYKCGGVSVPGG